MPVVNVSGEAIFYAHQGDADDVPLVLIHGAGGTHQSWLGVMSALTGCNTCAPDLPAHGASAGVGRDSVAAYAAVIAGFLDALSLPSAIIGGTSLGGAIAQWMALQHPQRVRGLILASTGAKLRVHPDILQAAREGRPIGSAAILGGGENAAPQPARPANAAPAVVHGDWVACDTFNVMERLGEIACPTLVIVGSQDVMTPPKYAAYLAAHIRGAKLVTIEGAGHSASREKPAEMAQAVQAFVDSIARA